MPAGHRGRGGEEASWERWEPCTGLVQTKPQTSTTAKLNTARGIQRRWGVDEGKNAPAERVATNGRRRVALQESSPRQNDRNYGETWKKLKNAKQANKETKKDGPRGESDKKGVWGGRSFSLLTGSLRLSYFLNGPCLAAFLALPPSINFGETATTALATLASSLYSCPPFD